MNPNEIEVGMRVRITKIDITTKRYKSTPEMIDMVGGVYKVYEIRKTRKADHEIGIYMEGWNWAPEDLFPPIAKVIKGGKFDPTNLM
jgi:hypothetical protein